MIQNRKGGILELPCNLKQVGEGIKRGLGDFTSLIVGFLKSRDPLLEVVALPGGFKRAIGSNRCFAAIIPGDSTAELVITNGINNFLNLYNICLFGRIILTWFPQAPQVLVTPLSTLCDPYLNLFRGLIPPLGQIDFSPILAFLLLNVLTSTGEALPAEIPKDMLKESTSLTVPMETSRHHKPSELHGWAISMRQKMARRKSSAPDV